jgi:hypothetical protein
VNDQTPGDVGALFAGLWSSSTRRCSTSRGDHQARDRRFDSQRSVSSRLAFPTQGGESLRLRGDHRRRNGCTLRVPSAQDTSSPVLLHETDVQLRCVKRSIVRSPGVKRDAGRYAQILDQPAPPKSMRMLARSRGVSLERSEALPGRQQGVLEGVLGILERSWNDRAWSTTATLPGRSGFWSGAGPRIPCIQLRRSTTTPPSTGSTCALSTRSNPPSPPSGSDSGSRRDPAPAPPKSRWPSSSSSPHRPGGAL